MGGKTVEIDEDKLPEYHSENWQKDGISPYDNTPKTSDSYDIDVLKYISITILTAILMITLMISIIKNTKNHITYPYN